MAKENFFVPQKLPYERPQMGTIKLSGDEVMATGCKTSIGGTGQNGFDACSGGAVAPCTGIGS